jgi:hypothetical protein
MGFMMTVPLCPLSGRNDAAPPVVADFAVYED